ncbi:malto-oligosyltrehalose synthase [Undibacterium sp.]|uniref:malto-oligosyltrehalose synthase n=1 Tax=Undibacterium sp. TaxID=1914977 RepID=UPI00374D4FEE
MTIPRATVRLQLHGGFNFDDAAATVDYYAALGISHFYVSPIFAARPGSMHGYDIVDPGRINPELGGEAALMRLAARLREAGMGLIIDIVPNHMGVGADNPWWQDVLEWGQGSPYAEWFDIDWNVSDPLLSGKMLAPVLGAQYGDVLSDGSLALNFDADHGKISLAYHEHRFPISPLCYLEILTRSDSPALQQAINLGEQLMLANADRMRAQFSQQALHRQAREIYAELKNAGQSVEGRAAIDQALARFSLQEGESAAQVTAMHALLEQQHYRLAWWRCAADQLNWRRFFEVSDLAGMRVERDDVFDASHALVFRLYQQGLIDGVRVDHVDGLADPKAYCRKLQNRLQSLDEAREPYIVVEKILALAEQLRADWAVHGTTGYDFMDQVSALLHDPQGEQALTGLWERKTSSIADFDNEVRSARRQLLAANLSGEFEAAARALLAVARSDVATRDFSMAAIRRVLHQLLLYFPVYRTYVDVDGRDAADQAVFEFAAQQARLHLRSADHGLLDAIGAWLGSTGSVVDEDGNRHADPLRQRAITRFQQLTPPLAAKSVEDTAFYRYGRLLSRNEVGSSPGQFFLSAADFHAACLSRAKDFPHAMLATATHDHKRGEDLRARLAVLSEMPQQWAEKLDYWMSSHAVLRVQMPTLDGGSEVTAPSSADQMMLYQMLAGAWPAELSPQDADGVAQFARRIAQWQSKAIREAKQVSDWIEPDHAYEEACHVFLSLILDTQASPVFLQDLAAWARHIAPAAAVNSLAQTLLRMTVPGVPDLYQASDLEDLTLVDPDNRHAIDYALRRLALENGTELPQAGPLWRGGRAKQQLIAATLALRARHAALFAEGSYIPLQATGPLAEHVLAFMRRHGESACIVVVVRLPASLQVQDQLPMWQEGLWQENTIRLPANAPALWQNHFKENGVAAEAGSLALNDALAGLPFALLTNTPVLPE